jgi:hypothetical protein
MTYTSLQLKERLPIDIWRLISEFNKIIFMKNDIIFDVSGMCTAIEKYLSCKPYSIINNMLVAPLSRRIDKYVLLKISDKKRYYVGRNKFGYVSQGYSNCPLADCNPFDMLSDSCSSHRNCVCMSWNFNQ